MATFTMADRIGSIGGYIGGIGTLLGGIHSGMGVAPYGNGYVTKDELAMMRDIIDKDSTIADLKAESAAEKKMTEVYRQVRSEIKELSNEVRANYKEQSGVNLAQATYNASNTAAIGCMQSQIAALQGMTKLVVPNGSVCPGWGDVTITPATT